MDQQGPAVEVSVGRQGRLVIPAVLRRSLGLGEGDTLVARQEQGRLVLEKPSAIRQRLRDRFAGYALIGLTAAGGDLADCGRDEIAKEAWRQADSMLEARKK